MIHFRINVGTKPTWTKLVAIIGIHVRSVLETLYSIILLSS